MHHVVTGALVEAGRVLLGHRAASRRWYPDVWDLPGGHVDDGESELDALRRELHEELGVEVTAVEADPVARITDPVADLQLGLWLVRAWAGVPVNRCLEEHDEVRWISPAELPGLRLAHPGYADLLGRLLTENAR
ncbi:NUDIX domain-containing protein [Blastococcus mobilis]|uniref:NUDIX domain-containing protein n=1 Tax=Blastococcus mobilis TaxID=1938746 RepID=UPI000B792129|nr:NUDIX domain-containing protein [Blastococcus mobilis]